MKTASDDSRIDERVEPKRDCAAAFIREEIEAAMKRVERRFNASKAAVSDTIEEGKISARRLLKRGRNAAEDCLDDAVYQVKHNPRAAVALSFGAGAIAASCFLLLFLVPRGGKKLDVKSRGTLEAPGTLEG